ncbi:outer membrane protein assembly factor BamB family protein [Aeoliella mucimassa]|uniref:Outer membrane biogenesis protein BamB n=1 Tax=Aeoliella mucimassa TaxID=2527972 RepID=A0A518AWA9_9BACT|nr:PQQ-binding-like beta-propeller repeat protein [Aeoliella mucimassa]QDU59013.1 outer membrane biogenesis protein BamB [Aeoliella mucimassa]
MPVRALLAITLVVCASNARAQWPQWRGPSANVVAPSGDYPVEFSPEKNCLWQVDLGGEGASTPILSDGNIYVTLDQEEHDVIASYDLQGTERWRVTLGEARGGKNRAATGSNSSPVTDGKLVVCYFKSGEVACLTTEGEKKWSLNLQDKYGADTLWWDLGTSPVLTSAGVCIAVMQEGDSYLVTLDLETGDEVWKVRRQYERPSESDQAYTTPTVLDVDGQETIVTFGADHLTGHSAETGKLLWQRDGFNPQDKGMWRVIASQTIADGVAIIPFGRAEYLACEPLGSEDSAGERRWLKKGIGTDVPSPVVHDGKVYVLEDGGQLTCLALATGDVLWEERLPRSRDKFYSSPLLAGGNLYCLRGDGTLFVVAADQYELLAENDLGDESVATPVPVDGKLLVRTRGKLFLFGE